MQHCARPEQSSLIWIKSFSSGQVVNMTLLMLHFWFQFFKQLPRPAKVHRCFVQIQECLFLFKGKCDIIKSLPVHSMERVWLIMVPPLVVSHVDRDGRVKCGEEVVGTFECKREKERKTETNEHWIWRREEREELQKSTSKFNISRQSTKRANDSNMFLGAG